MRLPVATMVLPSDLVGQRNGELDVRLLTECGLGGLVMHHVAARANRALVAAAEAAGHPVRATSTYRTLPGQVTAFDGTLPENRTAYTGRYVPEYLWAAYVAGGGRFHVSNDVRPWNGVRWKRRAGTAMSAVPGTSNHGWGLAADYAQELDGDPQLESVSTAFVEWLVATAHIFGFSAEAQSEAWHWRYVAGDVLPVAVLEYEEVRLPAHHVTIPAGAKGMDYSSARPDPTGWRFVIRYLASGPPRPKVVTRAEIDALHAKGVAVLLNWEWETTDADGGASRGAEYGAIAKRMATERGYPTSFPIIVSVDQGSSAAALPVHEAYVRAFAAAIAPYPVGVYGGTNLMARVRDIAVLIWQSNATSWSSQYPDPSWVDIRQHPVDPTGAYDPNTALRPFDAWLPSPGQPPPEETDMKLNYYTVTGANARFIGTPARVSWTGPGDDKIAAAIRTQIAAGNLVEVALTGGPNAFAASFLDGPLPVGDSLHGWTGAEFANTATILAGQSQVAGTVDQTARDIATAAASNAGQASVGASDALAAVDKIKAALKAAGT
jgi:hypothetical protein